MRRVVELKYQRQRLRKIVREAPSAGGEDLEPLLKFNPLSQHLARVAQLTASGSPRPAGRRDLAGALAATRAPATWNPSACRKHWTSLEHSISPPWGNNHPCRMSSWTPRSVGCHHGSHRGPDSGSRDPHPRDPGHARPGCGRPGRPGCRLPATCSRNDFGPVDPSDHHRGSRRSADAPLGGRGHALAQRPWTRAVRETQMPPPWAARRSGRGTAMPGRRVKPFPASAERESNSAIVAAAGPRPPGVARRRAA